MYPIQNSSFRGGPSRSVYVRPRGRAGKTNPPVHRHRSLILHRTLASARDTVKDSSDSSDPNDGASTALKSRESQTGPVTNWITKRDRHMQLISSAVYDQEIEARSKAIEHTRRQKSFERDLREKQKIQRHFETLMPNTYHGTHPSVSDASLSAYTLNIDGLSFQVGRNGSKLSRVFSMSNTVFIHPRAQ